jgi:hypothetical protein
MGITSRMSLTFDAWVGLPGHGAKRARHIDLGRRVGGREHTRTGTEQLSDPMRHLAKPGDPDLTQLPPLYILVMLKHPVGIFFTFSITPRAIIRQNVHVKFPHRIAVKRSLEL